MTNQPQWKTVANLGDVNPVEYGGLFVHVDETGVYSPELEKIEPPCDDEADDATWGVYRVCLDRCTFVNGILSDNQFHPESMAWFGFRAPDRPQDDCITNCAQSMGIDVDELIRLLCSEDPVELAGGYRCVLDYWGWENGDAYPLELTRDEITSRCDKYLNIAVK